MGETLGATLPDWFDLDALRGTVTTLIVVGGLVIIALFIWVRNVQRRVIAVSLVLVAIGGLFYYRTTLDDCEKTCSCRFALDYIDTDGCPERD